MTFNEQVTLIAHQCADILIANKMVKRPATFKKKLTVKTTATDRCWGGLGRKRTGRRYTYHPRISISTRREGRVGHYPEYARIAKDPEIGEFHSDDPAHLLTAIVAHEVAHAADHWTHWSGGHGSEWRRRYRVLRKALGITRDQLT